MKQSKKKPPTRRATVIGCVVAAICLAVAVPKIMGTMSDPEQPVGAQARLALAREAGLAPKAAPAPTAVIEQPVTGDIDRSTLRRRQAPPAVVPPAAPLVPTTEDGDVQPSVKLRWSEFETGDRVLAKISFVNRSTKDLYMPAAGEPNQGLAVVVRNEAGDEVRRVVESGRGDHLPRRLLKLAAGATVEIPVVVVDEEETPLAPGTYSVHVELRGDSRLERIGLPRFTAPHGVVRSENVPLFVTAKK